MATEKETAKKQTPWFGIAIIAACCITLLLPLFLAFGSAWGSSLTIMKTVRPFLLILTFIFIGLGYRKLYLIPKSSSADDTCVSEQVLQKQRLLFWMGSGLVLLLLAFSW
jgi:mercuric ion transport protein